MSNRKSKGIFTKILNVLNRIRDNIRKDKEDNYYVIQMHRG